MTQTGSPVGPGRAGACLAALLFSLCRRVTTLSHHTPSGPSWASAFQALPTAVSEPPLWSALPQSQFSMLKLGSQRSCLCAPDAPWVGGRRARGPGSGVWADGLRREVMGAALWGACSGAIIKAGPLARSFVRLLFFLCQRNKPLPLRFI